MLLWPAPRATEPLDAVVRLPGSKSLTNRYLVLAALATGPSRLRAPLRSRDTLLMADALRSLGADIRDVTLGETSQRETAPPVARHSDAGPAAAGERAAYEVADWLVTPGAVRGGGRLDCGLAGTVMRFLPPVAALADGPVRFDGDDAARRRPMGPILDALRALGVPVDDDGTGALPFTVHGRGAAGGVRGGAVTLDASQSSQFVSALLLAGARYAHGVSVHHDGRPVPSEPHIEMTVACLRAAGVLVDDTEANTWRVEPGSVAPLDVQVEPDLSNAGPFLAAALVTGGTILVPGWPERTTQAGDRLREILAAMARAGTDSTGKSDVRSVQVAPPSSDQAAAWAKTELATRKSGRPGARVRRSQVTPAGRVDRRLRLQPASSERYRRPSCSSRMRSGSRGSRSRAQV